MYESYYGLRERPFDLTASPRYLFLTSRHREALSNIQYGILGHKGLTLLLGEAGTGKTTLVRAALELHRSQNVTAAYLSNPTLTRAEFYEFLALGFALGPAAGASKTRFLATLNHLALERHRVGGVCTLIIDEAQSLPLELLEEVRLLSNIETSSEKLLPVVLAGQPELGERLNEPSLRQLKQRVALRCSLEPLDLRETAAYITKRIRIAGGDSAAIFTRDAVELVFRHSFGIPRTINVICDNALVTGFALDRKLVGGDIIEDVCRDFALESPARAPGAPAQAPGPVPAVRRDAAPVAPPASELFGSVSRRRRFSFF